MIEIIKLLSSLDAYTLRRDLLDPLKLKILKKFSIF